MTTMKKRPPIRQFSFQCNSPKVPERRKNLKKQFSEDLTEATTANINNNKKEIESPPNSIRVSLSAKGTKPPQSVKVAWSEIQTEIKKENFVKQKSLDKNTIFKPRNISTDNKPNKIVKQNLKIFLNNNFIKNSKDEQLSELSDSSYSSVDNNLVRRPKLILPLNPEITTNNDNVKNVFQKHIRKVTNQKSLFLNRSFSPIRSEISSTIVVPVISNKTISENIQKEPKINNEIIESNLSRPSTANSHTRKEFNQSSNQKRSSSASSISKKENQFRPPLIRQSSVPVKNETKSKFVASKRRVKTAKAKVRIADKNTNVEFDDKRNVLKRCVSVSEVETMVSLVSPSESENEEESEDNEKCKEGDVEELLPLKTSLVKENGSERSVSLRKTIKSVSFQQSTIHAIRSFSASFPERRKSMATALFLNTSKATQVFKIQEKRSPVNAIDDEEEERVPKRRLIRTKSAPLERRSSTSREDESPSEEKSTNNTQGNDIGKNEDLYEEKSIKSSSSSLSEGFDNCKERECWDMYCKMNEKGVTISFDTILRGLLTPTEYRLRSKTPNTPSSTVEDNYEITEN